MNLSPHRKTAFVTGGGRGIGRAISITLACQGFDVAINDISLEHAQSVAAEINALGREAIPLAGDISSPSAVNEMMTELCRRWPGLTALVNNAGIVRSSPLEEISPEEWDLVMAVNLRSMFLTAKAAFPKMREAGYGKIVNLASVAGLVGGGLLGNSCYAAAKAGVIAFTKGLAREGGPFGIRANSVVPALTDTEMTGGMDKTKRAAIIAQIPLGRAGRPDDIAAAVAFLASDASDFISGDALVVDGGFSRR